MGPAKSPWAHMCIYSWPMHMATQPLYGASSTVFERPSCRPARRFSSRVICTLLCASVAVRRTRHGAMKCLYGSKQSDRKQEPRWRLVPPWASVETMSLCRHLAYYKHEKINNQSVVPAHSRGVGRAC